MLLIGNAAQVKPIAVMVVLDQMSVARQENETIKCGVVMCPLV